MNQERKYIRHFFAAFLVAVLSLLTGSLLWNIKKENQSAIEYASKEAHGAYNKDLLYRRWASNHGGVYVPITDSFTPNPYLAFLPHRDILTESGEKLTLINPAYMTRQVHELAENQYGVKGHITSLNPIRPENKADEWETKVLKTFENGGTEVNEVKEIKGEKYLRLMHPMTVEPSCLKCHAHQGYKVGDIRGGISVSIPMKEYLHTASIKIKYLILSHLVILLLVLIFGWYAYRRFLNEMLKRDEMQKQIIESEANLRIQNDEYVVLNEDYKKLNTELKAALDKAMESERLKSAFLANMSHEIRTPMNGILGFVNLLNEPDLSKSQIGEYSAIINKSGDRLLTTINDIIDISKIEAGQVQLSSTEIDVNNKIEELYSFFLPEANEKGLSLTVEPAQSDQKLRLTTDEEKLHLVLSKLIKNAIKYTDKGAITLGYWVKQDSIEFYVKDSGIGIPKDRLKAIFNRFEQADISDKRVFEGSGLGLAISKAYVEMLDGTISVTSEEGKGSTFTVTIPHINKEEKEIEQHNKNRIDKTTAKRKLNLLVVEDDVVSSEFLEIVLKDDFQKIFVARNGLEAVEACKTNSEINLVLMDLKMPVMNGYDATKEIRKFNKDLIIIAQSAYALDGDKEKAIEAGCNDSITKPINKTKLLAMIQKLINEKI